MVHAVKEIHRVLAPGGILLDVRPLGDRWRVEVVSSREIKPTGAVTDLPLQTEGDRSANESMEQARDNQLFDREQEELFPYHYSWDTPGELEQFIAEDWQEFIELDEQTKRDTRSAWAVGDADTRVRIKMNVLISRWRKKNP